MSVAAVRTRSSRRFIFWGMRILLALTFVYTAVIKFAGADRSVRMFEHVGAGQWLRIVVGGLEITAAIGLLLPRLTIPVTVAIIALMTGAIIAEITFVDGNIVSALAVLVVDVALLWGYLIANARRASEGRR